MCMFIVQRSFSMVFHIWIYFTLIRLTPFISLSHSPLFNIFQCILLYQLHAQLQCILILFSLYHHSLFFSLFHYSIYVYICIIYIHTFRYTIHLYIYVYIHILGLASTYERTHMTFVFLNLAYLLNMMISIYTYLPASNIISLFFMAE
jgi:hypothetical protein